MNDFFELMDISYYSSDLNGSSLIVSEKNGSIRFISDSMGFISPDHFKKCVRFYPEDDFIFTTTDSSLGLRVWDREKEKEVYQYPMDSLGTHEYSRNGIIASICESGIKFFDLRTRYHISSLSYSLAEGLVWNGDNLFVFNSQSIIQNNIQNGTQTEIDVSSVQNIFISSGELFYVVLKNSKYWLVKNNLSFEIETVGWEGGVAEDGTIYIFGNNEIKFYTRTDNKLVDLKFIKRIDDIKFSRFNTYLFADKKLYIKEGSLFQ
ncbi:hypothetical protein NGRA_1647 [Nosema granulosis]|uniref:Uncharacterized protein n=1 Tax=Nosema granulosis TaxID=83296 RepID=A0A9P6KYF1_9MICR|nr:hypothetical protein NGRA_1647 [Nosema granulosis]